MPMQRPTVIVLLMAAIIAGCNETVGPGNPNIRHYRQNTVDASHPRMRLVLGSENLIGKVALVDVRFGSTGTLPRAEVTVQNLTNDRYTLEYMYRWEDHEGFSVDVNPVWKRFVLGPREIKSFQSVAPMPEAWSATFTVRLPDDRFIHQERTSEK